MISFPSASHFYHYYLHDEQRAQTLLDSLFDPHRSFSETVAAHLTTIQSYLSATRSLEEFCEEVHNYDNSVVCGLVWTEGTMSYRCRTCAISPCLSLCADCFHDGDHDGHDANMFRSDGGGICDCGDEGVMSSKGFFPTTANAIECCICQSEDDRNPLGFVVRILNTGTLGVREVHPTSDDHQDTFDDNKSSSNNPSVCCANVEDHLTVRNIIDQPRLKYANHKQKNDFTCAQFYEERLQSMLTIFSKEQVSNSVSISWRTGALINCCGHALHLSCYRQYLRSQNKKSNAEIDPNVEFKCPMCGEISNALICIPWIEKRMESNTNSVEKVADLIEKNVKPCIPAAINGWLTDFVQKMYLIVNPNYRTIDQHDTEITDDGLALFLVSTLRFNLENELFIRDTEHLDTAPINRRSCFRELFYICSLKYPYLVDSWHIQLWCQITGLTCAKLEKPSIPLLISDPIVLLLRILLCLPYSITIECYQVVVQALFNLTVIQALFTIICEMNRTEQEIWSNISMKKSNMEKYVRVISTRLLETNFNSQITNSSVQSIESIKASIRERCQQFLKMAGLIQHHLYQPITWWTPNRIFPSDFLWKNLIQELQLSNVDEPHWFCEDSLSLMINWLDELLIIDKQQFTFLPSLTHAMPVFHSPRFIDLPVRYSDLLRLCVKPRCPYCKRIISESIVCLICGLVYSRERSERNCCDKQRNSRQQHAISCGGGSTIFIDITSTNTLIEREKRYTYWASLYLDEHGEEDLHLKRGGELYLDRNRLEFLYSAWLSSSLDQLTNHWSTDRFDF